MDWILRIAGDVGFLEDVALAGAGLTGARKGLTDLTVLRGYIGRGEVESCVAGALTEILDC